MLAFSCAKSQAPIFHMISKITHQIFIICNTSCLLCIQTQKTNLWEDPPFKNIELQAKIQQTKLLVTYERFDDLFLFGLVWQYSSIQKNIGKVGSKSWILTCSCHITLSLPFYTDPDSKRELNFCNGYLSLLYFCLCPFFATTFMQEVGFLCVTQAKNNTCYWVEIDM